MAKRKMKRFVEGGEAMDELEAANASQVSQDIAKAAESAGAEATGSAILDKMRDDANKKRVARPTPKPAAKVAAKPAPVAEEKAKPAPKAAEAPVDETKLSLSDRFKLSRERARSGSGASDTRSVNQRIREKFGFSKGGSVSSASKRADGIAQRGKTRGNMC